MIMMLVLVISCSVTCMCYLTGAAYASSSASALPSSTFPPTITSFGSINPSTGGDALGSSAVPATDGLAAGRGCPVGDSAVDRSPVLVPSRPQQLNDPRDSISMPHPLHFQASSTPMVRKVNMLVIDQQLQSLFLTSVVPMVSSFYFGL